MSLGFEPLFVAYTKLLSLTGMNFRLYLTITNFITYLSVFSFAKKHSKSYWLSIYIFITYGFYLSTYNLLRQYMAVALILCALNYLIDRRILAFLIMVIIASLFHYTAIFCFLLIPFYFVHLNLKVILLYFLLCLFIWSINERIVNYLLTLPFKTAYIAIAVRGEGYVLLSVFMLIFLGSMLICPPKRWNGGKNSHIRLFFYLIMMTILLQILSLQFSLFVRVTLYFFLPAMLLFPNILITQSDNSSVYFSILIILILFFIWFLSNLHRGLDLGQLIAYKFMWEN